jgi:hypothetical protein
MPLRDYAIPSLYNFYKADRPLKTALMIRVPLLRLYLGSLIDLEPVPNIVKRTLGTDFSTI